MVRETAAKSALNRVRGMGFAWSLNPYQGCVHQCVFCYARETHAYRELDGVAAWGTELRAKVNVAAVLRDELKRGPWDGEHIAIGTATDPYQAIEGRYRLMRSILGALRDARATFHITTRSPLIVRDIDLLVACSRRANVGVALSIPTLDEALARRIEPTVAPPRQRLRAVKMLADAGVRVGVAVAPVLPDLTDGRASLHAVMEAAAAAGASHTWHNTLNLGAIPREAYFAFLRDQRPDLVPRYEALYRRGRYAERAYVDDVAARVKAARDGVRFARRQPLSRDRSGEQLPLEDQQVVAHDDRSLERLRRRGTP